MAPQPSSSEFVGVGVAAAEEVMANARDGLDALVAALWCCARSLGMSGAEVRPLGMSTGDGKEVASPRWSGMLGRNWKG